MANEIITTLHPDQDPDTNLYPNIKKENIPSQSVDRNRLDTDVNSLLNSINELHPSGVDTSANILAFTTNKGIYVATDTGNWYYWDGTQYVSGGSYQAVNIGDNSVLTSSLQDKCVTLSKLNSDIVGGGKFTLDTIDNRVALPELILRFNNVDITNLTLKFNYKKLAQSSTWSIIKIRVGRSGQYVQLSSSTTYDDSKTINTEYTYNHNQDVNLTGAYLIRIFFDRGTTAIGIKTLLYNIELIADGVKIPFSSYDVRDYITTENWDVPELATKKYVNDLVYGEKIPLDLTNRVIPNFYSVKDNSRRCVPIYLDYMLWYLQVDNPENIYLKDKKDTFFLPEPTSITNNVETISNTIEFESTKYEIPNININQIVTKDSVINSKINMLVIGDSVTAGFGAEGNQYWKELVTNIINEDIKYNRSTNINMLGTINRSSVTIGEITKYVNAEGRSGWGAYEYYGYANFVDSNNPFYDGTLETDCKFSINKWLERYRTMDDNGNRLTLGDGTGTEITSSNIDNINVCTPNYVVINLGHNDFYRHDNHRLYYDGILANIRSELPNAKIIVMVTMPLIHTLHKDLYKNYDKINGVPNINYANRYINNLIYWATYNNTDPNLYILPQYNITPTIESYKYKDVNPNIKAFDHYDNNGTQYGWAHPYKTAHIVWGYELYALVKYINANE